MQGKPDGRRAMPEPPFLTRNGPTGRWPNLHQGPARLCIQRVIQALNSCARVFWNDLISQSAPDFTRTYVQRIVAKPSVCPSEPREVARQFPIEFGEIARDHRYVEMYENRLLRLAVE
jgi:hypothetical protein